MNKLLNTLCCLLIVALIVLVIQDMPLSLLAFITTMLSWFMGIVGLIFFLGSFDGSCPDRKLAKIIAVCLLAFTLVAGYLSAGWQDWDQITVREYLGGQNEQTH